MKALHYKKVLGSVALSGMLSLTFASAALAASEFTGTLSNHVGPASTSSGTLTATVGSGSSGTVSGSTGGSGGSGSSGSRRHSVTTTTFASNTVSPGNDVIILLDDGSAAPASSGTFASANGQTLNGTGGGFDPSLEARLDEINSESNGQISPEDAVAFNTENNPLLNNDFTAAAGDSGISTGKTIAAIVLGLALLGLAGYAVNSLLAYRRENDL